MLHHPRRNGSPLEEHGRPPLSGHTAGDQPSVHLECTLADQVAYVLVPHDMKDLIGLVNLVTYLVVVTTFRGDLYRPLANGDGNHHVRPTSTVLRSQHGDIVPVQDHVHYVRSDEVDE